MSNGYLLTFSLDIFFLLLHFSDGQINRTDVCRRAISYLHSTTANVNKILLRLFSYNHINVYTDVFIPRIYYTYLGRKVAVVLARIVFVVVFIIPVAVGMRTACSSSSSISSAPINKPQGDKLNSHG